MNKPMKISNAEGRKLLAKQPKKQNNEESAMQISFVKWFRLTYPQYSKLLAHIPNEGKRSPRTGANLKKLGMLPGWPDIQLMIPKSTFSGLFIEMKVKGGKVSPKQEEILLELRKVGYFALVVWDLERAKQVVIEYLMRND